MSDNPQSGFTKDAAAARSKSFYQGMNPQGMQNVLRNHLARMLPLHRYQNQVYRLGQKHPPGFEDGFTPIWECATALLPARQTTQLRINFQNQFHLIAVMGNSTLAGGFRAQIFDTKKQYLPNVTPGVRLAGRGVNAPNYFGSGGKPFFLRSPHPFTEPDAQALVIVQNQDTSGANNEIQVVLFGVALRFNWPD